MPDPRVDVLDLPREPKVVKPGSLVFDPITFCFSDADQCGAEREQWTCTREAGHSGKHIAHADFYLVCGWWEDK